MKYHKLKKSQRWMGIWEKTLITDDFVNIPCALTERLKDIYPINEVPTELVFLLQVLEYQLEITNDFFDEFIELVNDYVSKGDYDNGGV